MLISVFTVLGHTRVWFFLVFLCGISAEATLKYDKYSEVYLENADVSVATPPPEPEYPNYEYVMQSRDYKELHAHLLLVADIDFREYIYQVWPAKVPL